MEVIFVIYFIYMNQKKILTFIAALMLFIPSQISHAQTLPLKHYSSKDGLPSSTVSCIYQDSSGYLWFGTEFGVSRFSGIRFQNVLAEKEGLKNDYIGNILEDRRGNLWIGTRGGGLICRSSEEIRTYTTTDGLPSNRITTMAMDQEGNLWLGTRSGISMFNGENFTTYSKKDGLVDDFVRGIIIDEKGNLWIGTENGISYFTKKKEQFINYTTINGLISNKVQALMMDHKGNIWIGTQSGLSCYQKEKEPERAAFISYSTKDGMANNYVNVIIEDRNRNIWIGTERGLSLFSSSSDKFTNYYTKNGFPSDKILTIFEDREENIWFGTPLGASRLQSLKITNFSVKDGLPNNFIYAIIEEREGKYWIGTDKGLSCYSYGTFETYTTRNGLINDSILNLLKDRAGNIWIATNGGLSVYSSRSGKFTNYTVNDGLPHEIVLSLVEDMNSNIWIGTTKGLCRFINGSIHPPNFKFKQDSMPVHAILHDSKGNLWFSNTKGLWKISILGEKSTKYHYSTRDGLIHNEVKSLFEDSRGRIWVGTQHGLSCFSKGKFKNYTTADGLSNNACLFVLEDDDGNLWIGTVNGISRFDGKSFKTYTSGDGLIYNEMNQCTCLKDSQGNLWFGTVNGISRFNPHLDRDNTIPPPIYITNFSVWERDHPISDNIGLKHNQNYLKFDFIGLCFTSPKDVVYKYRLEGIDKDWSFTKERYIPYRFLTPGKYVFKVSAINNDGIESLKPAEIPFRILPPFWQTLWFKIIVGLFLLAVASIVALFQIRRIKEKAANEAKTKQLVMAQRMKLLGILAGGAVHDLKNLLGIIIGYSDLVVESVDEEEDEKKEAIDVIKSTAKTAFQVVKQMLAFTRQTDDETTASNLTELMEEILEILKITVPKKITILWEPPEEELLLYINPVKFKQVVLNLCLNAVQAMQDVGELKISLFKNPARANQIILEVSDTGTGIEEEIQNRIFDPLFTTREEEKGAGLGLFVVKQIVDEYGGKIQIQSKLGEGTTFSINFPIRKPTSKKLAAN